MDAVVTAAKNGGDAVARVTSTGERLRRAADEQETELEAISARSKTALSFIQQQKHRISSEVEEQEKNLTAAVTDASKAIDDQKNKIGADVNLLL